jgi:hypothetical protein
MASFKKAKLNPSGTLSLLTVGKPSNSTNVVAITKDGYKALKAGKRVRYADVAYATSERNPGSKSNLAHA